jgi:hypothetical protein
MSENQIPINFSDYSSQDFLDLMRESFSNDNPSNLSESQLEYRSIIRNFFNQYNQNSETNIGQPGRESIHDSQNSGGNSEEQNLDLIANSPTIQPPIELHNSNSIYTNGLISNGLYIEPSVPRLTIAPFQFPLNNPQLQILNAENLISNLERPLESEESSTPNPVSQPDNPEITPDDTDSVSSAAEPEDNFLQQRLSRNRILINILRRFDLILPDIKPSYFIENFNENLLGISEINYPYEGDLLKIYMPTMITLDKNYVKNLLYNEILSLKEVLKDKEVAILAAFYIKTGILTPEVQPHYDDINGNPAQPIPQDEIQKLNIKNIKDTEIIDTIDDSSICTLSQAPIKELMEEGEEIVVLECNHYFSKELIYKHLSEYGNKCPNCNKVLSESVERAPLSREEILENNFYKAAYFIFKYCDYYRSSSNNEVLRLNQLNEYFILAAGFDSMETCESILAT